MLACSKNGEGKVVVLFTDTQYLYFRIMCITLLPYNNPALPGQKDLGA